MNHRIVTIVILKKQPKTTKKVDEAINAMHVSCCWALRYKGGDLITINKIKVFNLEEQIDYE